MPQFDGHFLTPMLFWTIISFVLLLWLLKRFALPGIMEVMEGRRDRIREDLESAEQMRAEAAKLKAENEANLERAKEAANEVLARAQEQATALLAENEARMKAEGERILAEANRTLTQERQKAVADLRGLAADLAVTAAGKFVSVGMDESAQLKLVDDTLDSLEAQFKK